MHYHEHENHAHKPQEAITGEATVYTCPMHPEVRQDKPGLCPDCGMNLVPDKSSGKAAHGDHKHAEFDKHAGHSTNIFARRFWASLALSVPVVLYSDILFVLFGWRAPAFAGSDYVPFILGSVIFWYGGWIFVISAYRELRARLPGMMTLIALAITTAYVYSVAVILLGGEETLFWELATLITIMLLGHWIEMRAVQGAQGALKELSRLLPDTAEVIRDGNNLVITLSELREKDIIFMRPGSKIPADAIVTDGQSEVNESMVTGESKPLLKRPGDKLIAGTVNGNSSLTAEVTGIGEHTFLAGIMRLVAEAQASKSRLQMLSDRAALYLTVIAVTSGIITFLAWLLVKAEPSFAVNRLVAVLVIACPHALGLAIPLVASISTTMAARNGLLIRQRLALEAARSVNTVIFDKTGTLTTGEFGVEKFWGLNGYDDKEALRLAASVDSHSEHYVSRAIVKKAKEEGLSLVPVIEFKRLAGQGVEGYVDSTKIQVGGATLLDGQQVPEEQREDIMAENAKGKTIIYVLKNDQMIGAIALADLIRDESREAVRDLKALGIRIAMITGDSDNVAKWVAQDLGIDEYFARVLPHQKAERVKELQMKGQKVAMVGDGINDAPALTQADVGIAIGAGTNVAVESAGIILVRNDPRDITKIVRLSRLTYRKMIQNLFWATGYNVIALPLAAGALAFKGVLLQPALAAIFMSLSTVIVAINAVLLKNSEL